MLVLGSLGVGRLVLRNSAARLGWPVKPWSGAVGQPVLCILLTRLLRTRLARNGCVLAALLGGSVVIFLYWLSLTGMGCPSGARSSWDTGAMDNDGHELFAMIIIGCLLGLLVAAIALPL